MIINIWAGSHLDLSKKMSALLLLMKALQAKINSESMDDKIILKDYDF